ncbi:MAG: hypothetical protein IPK53_05905 [bacterium]|nr:hypothetical protein [bacterium]
MFEDFHERRAEALFMLSMFGCFSGGRVRIMRLGFMIFTRDGNRDERETEGKE